MLGARPASPFHPLYNELRSRKRDSGRHLRSDRAAATQASTAAGEQRSALDGAGAGRAARRVRPEQERTPAAAPAPAGSQPSNHWIVWVLLGALVGSGARFIHLPGTLVPLIVGFGASAGVVIWLRFLGVPGTATLFPLTSGPTPNKRSPGPATRPAKRDPASRLPALVPRRPRSPQN
jgi:hypothetical protein